MLVFSFAAKCLAAHHSSLRPGEQARQICGIIGGCAEIQGEGRRYDGFDPFFIDPTKREIVEGCGGVYETVPATKYG
jgi:hypothetical protein